MKPILFLDVDDTMIAHPKGVAGTAAAEFLRWAQAHFEVRWLTMWAVSGTVNEEYVSDLARILKVSEAEIRSIHNPHAFPVWNNPFDTNWRDKSHSIRKMLLETPTRDWGWVEDPYTTPSEREFISEHPDRYFETSCSADPHALIRTAQKLADRFVLPALGIAVVRAQAA